MAIKSKKIKLSKKELEKLAEALKNKKLEKISNETIKKQNKTEKSFPVEENKFIESEISLEKISPVLKPVAKQHERLEQVASSFVLQKKPEDKNNEKPYEFGEQKYFSKSEEYKTLDKIQNLQTPAEIEKGMSHMGVEQDTKRKPERFFEEKQGQKYSAEFKSLEEVKKKDKNKFYVPR